MTAYIEVSFINRAVDKGRSGISLATNLGALGFRPVVGMTVIYEMAKCFLTDHGISRGRQLFSFVDELEPTFHWPPQQLMERELEALRHGTEVLPFVDHLNHISTIMEVRKLRTGFCRRTREI